VTRRWLDVLWLGVIGLLAVMVFVWAHPNDRDSSMLNRGWNGLSQAAIALDASALLTYDELADIVQPATLVVMPHLQLESSALTALDHFIAGGGTLIVLDDFGYGNDLLEALEVEIRLNGALLVDPLYCHRNASMPRIEFASPGRVGGSMVVVLNQATWLEVNGGGEVFARSSYFSYGDANGDGRHGDGELDGPLPVGAWARNGMGRIVVVSDSSLLLNSMVEVGDNLDSLAQFVTGEVLFDQVHLPEAQVDRSKEGFSAVRSTLSGGAGVVALVVLVCGLAVAYAWYNRGRHDNE
jgi:hypothetical protein